MKRQEAENEKMKEKGIEEGSLVLRYNSKLDSTFHTAFQTKWEGPYKVEKKFKNGSYQLTYLDGKRHKRRVNGIRLKKYFARLMLAIKEEDREAYNECQKDEGSTEEEDLNITSLFVQLLDMNVSADKWGC